MKKCKILVPIGCRSDSGLSMPIRKRLDKHDEFNCIRILLTPADFKESYNLVDQFLKGLGSDIDLMICVGDRIEMTAAACAAFHNGVRIAHVYAGITNYPLATLDDVNRHCITLWSDIAFCEDVHSAQTILHLWENIRIDYSSIPSWFELKKENFKRFNIHVVGISHLDDLELDESLVPSEPYDLILINPTTLMKDLHEFNTLHFYLQNPIYIGSNPDPNLFPIEIPKNCKYYDNLHRPQFLGLLKNCTRYITNSSNVNYEAIPLGLKEEQIIQVGLRNKNRSTPKKLETGASQKIVDILERYFKDNL